MLLRLVFAPLTGTWNVVIETYQRVTQDVEFLLIQDQQDHARFKHPACDVTPLGYTITEKYLSESLKLIVNMEHVVSLRPLFGQIEQMDLAFVWDE